MRCFVALEFDENAVDFLSKAAGEIGAVDASAGVIPRQNMHLTLCFLGEVPQARALEAARKVSGIEFGPFEVVLGGIGFFPSQKFIRIVWMAAESGGKIEQLHSVARGLVAGGTQAERENRPFNAHITLARIKSPQNAPALLRWAAEKNAQNVSLKCRAVRVVLKQTRFLPGGGVEYVDAAP